MEVLEAVRQVRTEAVASRRPLIRKGATKNPEVKLFNPRFEEDFVAGKNYDPDRCCAPRTISFACPKELSSKRVLVSESAPCASLSERALPDACKASTCHMHQQHLAAAQMSR